jgi:hypothetical protein
MIPLNRSILFLQFKGKYPGLTEFFLSNIKSELNAKTQA